MSIPTYGQFGGRQAENYARELETSLSMLVEQPGLGRRADDLRPRLLRLSISITGLAERRQVLTGVPAKHQLVVDETLDQLRALVPPENDVLWKKSYRMK